MSTLILAVIILVAAYFAGRIVYKATKNGGCVGCDSGSCNCSSGSCPHCQQEPSIKFKK